jgi:hypothetical protein
MVITAVLGDEDSTPTYTYVRRVEFDTDTDLQGALIMLSEAPGVTNSEQLVGR